MGAAVNHCNRGRYEKVFTACYFGCFFDRTCRMHTVKGVGKDVAALGNGVDHAATTVSKRCN